MNSEKSGRVLIALGENWAPGKHGTKRRLSIDSIVTTLAAYKLLQTGQFDTLIFSTGYTNGRKQIAEADAMANLLSEIAPDIISHIRIIRETVSYDTPTNLAEVEKILQQEALEGPITIVAPTNHLLRTRRIARGFGMDVNTIEAEKVLDIPVPRVRLYERVLRPLALIDPEGRFPRIITRRRLR